MGVYSLDVIRVGIRDPGAPQGVWKGVLVKLAFTHLHHPPLTASIYSYALPMKVCETISHQEEISGPPVTHSLSIGYHGLQRNWDKKIK